MCKPKIPAPPPPPPVIKPVMNTSPELTEGEASKIRRRKTRKGLSALAIPNG